MIDVSLNCSDNNLIRTVAGHAPWSTAAVDAATAMDPIAFAREMLGFEPDAIQKVVLDRAILRGILNCTRQWGKSTVMAVKALHQAYCYPETLTLVLSASERQSGLLVQKIRRFTDRLGVATRRDGINRISMVFPNGSTIVGLPDNEDKVRGFTDVRLMLVDEAARADDHLYYAAQPMLNQQEGAIWLLSTPKGRRGFFYNEWAGPEKWTRICVRATECSRHSPAFLAEQRRKLPDYKFREEFLCEFVDSDDTLFPTEVVERSIREDIEPLLKNLKW